MAMQQQSTIVGRSIYLAGKITAWSKGMHDWRFDIVDGLEGAVWNYARHRGSSLLPKAIFGTFHYVGPFFTNLDDFLSGHGGGLPAFPHAVQPEITGMWKHSGDTPLVRRFVTQTCLSAISSADLVFAWIDSPDCYGTVFELGYAHALGKHVAVYFTRGDFFSGETTRPWPYEEEAEPDPLFELWFMYVACQGQIARSTPADALQETITNLGWHVTTYESPLEAAFADEWGRQSCSLAYPLVSQYPIENGRYRLDFAYPAAKVGIELDGYTYHSNRDAFTRDRQRQRDIEATGWHIIRFSGDELRHDVRKCVQEAAHFLSIQQHRQQKD